MFPKHIKLNYNFTDLQNADYTTHEGSCISHQIYEQVELEDKYGPFPDTYVYDNTIINQLWWNNEQVDFDYIENQLGVDIKTISTIRQPPGNIIPIHHDIFYQIKKKYDVKNKTIVRANIHLNDWAPGHIIQYEQNDNWINYTHWKTGEGLMFTEDSLHIGINAGRAHKYTVQISGFLK
jgi:hypothetical protein